MDREFEAEIKRMVIEQGFVRLSRHAQEEAEAEDIEMDEIIESVIDGSMIEDYPAVTRTHDCLILGWSRGRPIHCVCTIINNKVLIITVYIPNPAEWADDYRTRI